MVDPISALCLAALTQISGSMTAAGVAGGAIGVAMNVVASRADAMLCAVTNATAGQFIRNVQEPVNHDLLKGMIAAHQRAFRQYAETLDGQATAADRQVADKIIRLAKKDVPFDILPIQSLMASVTPLLVESVDISIAARRDSFVAAAVIGLVKWIEAETGETMPQRFIALLTEPAPNGRKSWETKFQLHLAETIKTNDRYSKIFIASNIAELVGRTISIEEIADQMLASVAALHSKVDVIDGKVNRLLEMANAGQLGLQMSMSKIDRRAFVYLARKINLTVDDEVQALAELTDAVERLLAFKQRGDQPTNFGVPVDQAIKRMVERSMQGNFDAAASEGAQAFLDWKERQETERQSGIALIQANIEQHRFRHDAGAVCEWVMRRVDLECSSEASQFDILCREAQIWIDRGFEKGINFDLGVATMLASDATKLASTSDERGKALILHGEAVSHLGRRSNGEYALQVAVNIYRSALDELARERVPLEWGKCQNCLGDALSALGSCKRSITMLHEAEAAFLNSLAECSHDRDPEGWAAATINLGSVLGKLGRHDKDNIRLEKAVTAYRSVLDKITREDNLTNWAGTQNNLGVVLNVLGEREFETVSLEASIAAFDEVLLEWTREQQPLHWAGVMANRGRAMVTLAERTGDGHALTRAEEVLSQAGSEADGRDSSIIRQCEMGLAHAADIREQWEQRSQ